MHKDGIAAMQSCVRVRVGVRVSMQWGSIFEDERYSDKTRYLRYLRTNRTNHRQRVATKVAATGEIIR